MELAVREFQGAALFTSLVKALQTLRVANHLVGLPWLASFGEGVANQSAPALQRGLHGSMPREFRARHDAHK
jgi:hypothetical protein